MSDHFVYILTNASQTSVYIGMTSDLPRRIYEHKHGLADGFTKKYRCDRLVYFEPARDRIGALTREKQLKGWRRQRKVDLINLENPKWEDLSGDFL